MKTAKETEELKKLFDDGSLLHRDYKGHEQMLMNEGTFIELCKQYAEQKVKNFNGLPNGSNLPVMLSLPSDEKINLEALATEGEYRNSEWKRGYKIGFMNCAKWMKEQIEKLNKRGNGA